MDYLLVGIASILFPYVLNLSGIDYQVYAGMLGSLQNSNKYKLELVEKNSKYHVSRINLITYTGYGVRPDFFIDYNLSKGRLWLSPTFGWEPLSTGIEFKTKLKSSSSTGSSTSVIYYTKGAYIGFKLGLKIFESKPELNNWYTSFGMTPYVVGGVVPVSYESESYYQGNHEKRFNFYYGAGIKLETESPWAAFVQYKVLHFNTNSSGLDKQVNINESEIQFGIAYWFRGEHKKYKIDKCKNYDNIINAINQESKECKDNVNLPAYTSPEGTVIKDNSIKPSYSNIKQTNSIFENNKNLKENNKLLNKTQKSKTKESYNLNILNDVDL